MSNKVVIWLEAPRTWDTIIIGGYKFPGMADVHPSVSRKIITEQAEGDEGQTHTDLGYDGAKVDVTILVSSQEELNSLCQIIAQFKPTPSKTGGKPNPLEVIHPATKMYGITGLTLMHIEGPYRAGNETGVYEAKLEFIEFISEVKKGKAKGLNIPDAALSLDNESFAAQTAIGELVKPSSSVPQIKK